MARHLVMTCFKRFFRPTLITLDLTVSGNNQLVWYAPHKQGARPMARHPLPPQFKKY